MRRDDGDGVEFLRVLGQQVLVSGVRRCVALRFEALASLRGDVGARDDANAVDVVENFAFDASESTEADGPDSNVNTPL